MLLFSNPMKFGMLHALGSVFTFIGKLFISAISGVIGYMVLDWDTETKEELNSQLFPVIVFILIGYVISTLFFMIYGIAADTIILCFFHDKEIQAKGGRPTTAPAPMQGFYEKFKK